MLEKTGNDEDEVARLIAAFYKQQGEAPSMKHSAVRRSSRVALVQTCNIHTCRLEFVKEDDPKLKYMLKQFTAEYDPTDRSTFT